MTRRSTVVVGWKTCLQASALATVIGWIATSGTESPAIAQSQDTATSRAEQPPDGSPQPGTRGGTRGRRFGAPSAFEVLQRAEVREDLKINDDQSKKIDELASEFDNQRRELGSAFRAGSSAEDLQKAGEQIREKSDALRRDAEIQVKEVLTAEQFRRYGQIKLQIAGISELRQPETADSLKLTEAQRVEVSKARDEADAKMRALGLFGSSETRQKISEERDAALLAILTAEQKVAWQAALGTPLAATKPAADDRKSAEKKSADESVARPNVDATAPKAGKDVVADFAGTKEGATGVTNSESQERTLSFSFRFAPWEMVLRRFAEEAGLTLDMNDVPPGTLNHYDHQKYTPAEALDVLNGYLLRRGFILVRRDRFLVVINIDNGIPPNLIPQVSAAELPKRGRNELLSVVFPLTDADAKTAAEDVKELLGPQGKVVPLTKVNRLLVTDIGTNLQRINELLTGLGVVEDAKGTGFRSFKLVHVTAVDAERMIRDLFNLPARGSATRAAALAATTRPQLTSDRRDDRDRDRGGRGGWDWRGGGGRWGDSNGGQTAPAPAATPAPVASVSKIQLTIDTRTNTLLVTASGEDLHLIEQAIKTIDVAEGGSAVQSPIGRRSNQPQVEVYPVENADIQVVVDMIDATVPGLTLRTDAKTRRINVFATPEEQEQVRNIVKQLDGGAGESVTVIQLHKTEPLAAATSLRNLFSANRTDPPSIEADSLGRRLMVRGSPEQVAQIRKLLADLGEEGDGLNLAARSSGGPIRTVAPGSRSAEELVELAQRLMPQSEGSFLRVVPPSSIAGPSFRLRDIDEPVNRGSRQFRRVPALPESEVDSIESPENDSPRQPQRMRRTEAPNREEIERLSRELEAALEDLDDTVVDEQDDSPAETTVDRIEAEKGEASATDAADPEAEEVRITSYDGKVIIASENLKALDQLERLLQSLAQTASRKTRWTVYYLRSADATETATILGSLFPAGSVTQPSSSSSSGLFSGFRGGIASLGSSLMDATGLGSMGQSGSLRILPETRSNALFIAGPDDQVKQVLEALEVLDAAQLPPSLKDRAPRRIAVEHADVDDVAAIVRDVYKEELEPPQAANPMQGGRGGGGFNPLAMLMGGGGNQNTKQRGVQLTIGVDRRTSTLIVSASDQLFRQIEDLVQSLDDSAQEARRTVRVESIRTGSSELVETALKPLLGKVSVSSTGRAAPTNGSTGGPPPGVGGSSGSDDSRRAFFQQMMMERMMQGGGGSSFGRGGNGTDGGGRRSGFGQGGDSGGRGFGGGRRSRSGNN